jgi:hypothetical protein
MDQTNEQVETKKTEPSIKQKEHQEQYVNDKMQVEKPKSNLNVLAAKFASLVTTKED